MGPYALHSPPALCPLPLCILQYYAILGVPKGTSDDNALKKGRSLPAVGGTPSKGGWAVGALCHRLCTQGQLLGSAEWTGASCDASML